MNLLEIVLRIGTKFQALTIRVSDEVITMSDGTQVQAIQFVKSDGTDGAIQFWTKEGIDGAVADKELLNLDRAKQVFAGVDPESL